METRHEPSHIVVTKISCALQLKLSIVTGACLQFMNTYTYNRTWMSFHNQSRTDTGNTKYDMKL